MIKMERILTCKRTTLKRIAFRGNQSSAGQKQHQYGMSLEQLQAGPLLGPWNEREGQQGPPQDHSSESRIIKKK